MLTILECRKILGDKYKNHTDKQIELIRAQLYKFAKMDKKMIKQNMKWNAQLFTPV